ncbi:hypothetical protein GW17_00043309 [Ensete ventricosum]|nr:hypothetical protein GW17_00043309 [Ensete ventricosum]
MHLYNAWLPPVVAEETRREEESFAAVVRSVKDLWRRDDPDSVYSTLKWISEEPEEEKMRMRWWGSTRN